MKIKNKIISGMLVMAISISQLAGCAGETTGAKVKEQEKRNIKTEIKETKYNLVQGGKSDYVILIPENATENEQFAATELQFFLKEATGTELPVQTEGKADTSKAVLSVGNTKASQNANVSPTYEDVKSNGFVLRTIEDDCYIKGFSDIGTRNGIYEWLYYSVDYECYAEDEIFVNKTDDLKLLAFEQTVNPSFEWRAGTGGEMISNETYTYRMRMNEYGEIYVLNRLVHNSMSVIDPTVYDYTSERYKDWYSEAVAVNPQHNNAEWPAQLCYSNAEVLAQYIENVVNLLQEGDANVMLLGMEDNVEWCTCQDCTASKEKYGTNSAVMIKFANKVQEAISEWCAKNRPNKTPIKCIFFAYYETVKPPVTYDEKTNTYEAIDDSVKLHKDLGVMYAPITASYAHPFDSEKNEDTAKQIEGWGALTDNLHIWTYSMHVARFMIMKNTFEVMQSNYKYLLDNGAVEIYDQTESGQVSGTTGWARAKWYVMSKLQWNVDLNMDELLDDFFANYYDAAGDTMKKIFEEERQWMTTLYENEDLSGRIHDDLQDAKYWSYPMLKNALAQFEQAYEEIETYRETDAERYKQLYDRITMETLQYRYLLISIYGTNYTEDELLNMKYTFKNDVIRLDVKQVRENVTFDNLWKEWNI